MQSNGYVGNAKILTVKILEEKTTTKKLMVVSCIVAIGRKGFTVFWACQTDVELREKRECEENMEEELKTSQKMWYQPDPFLTLKKFRSQHAKNCTAEIKEIREGWQGRKWKFLSGYEQS